MSAFVIPKRWAKLLRRHKKKGLGNDVSAMSPRQLAMLVLQVCVGWRSLTAPLQHAKLPPAVTHAAATTSAHGCHDNRTRYTQPLLSRYCTPK